MQSSYTSFNLHKFNYMNLVKETAIIILINCVSPNEIHLLQRFHQSNSNSSSGEKIIELTEALMLYLYFWGNLSEFQY